MNQPLPTAEQSLQSLIPVIQGYKATRNEHAFWETCINVIGESLSELARLKSESVPKPEDHHQLAKVNPIK